MICPNSFNSVFESVNEVSFHSKKVAILLCTFNGQKYLSEQMDSFIEQTYRNWELWVSDDCSLDDTIIILDKYRSKFRSSPINISNGPSRGFAVNFLSLTCNPNIFADYYAYSDQDDIWAKDKIETAVQWLNSVPVDKPAMYCSRSLLVDKNNYEIGYSDLFLRSPSFSNALVQSIGGANTIVFNCAARNLVQKVGVYEQIVSHDWLMYLLVTGADGIVFYDPIPKIRYRQHESNLVGANTSLRAKIKRIGMMLRGDYSKNIKINLATLQKNKDILTPQNKVILNSFIASRKANAIKGLIFLYKFKIRRQTFSGNIGLLLAVMLRKF